MRRRVYWTFWTLRDRKSSHRCKTSGCGKDRPFWSYTRSHLGPHSMRPLLCAKRFCDAKRRKNHQLYWSETNAIWRTRDKFKRMREPIWPKNGERTRVSSKPQPREDQSRRVLLCG